MRINKLFKERIGSYIFSLDNYKGFNKFDKSGRIHLDEEDIYFKKRQEKKNLINCLSRYFNKQKNLLVISVLVLGKNMCKWN